MRKIIFIILCTFMFAGTFFSYAHAVQERLVYVTYQPVCGINPWEEYWIKAHHKYRLLDVPRGDPQILEKEEKKIVKEYLDNKGINAKMIGFMTYKERFGEEMPYCAGDECPLGYTLIILIPKSQLDTLIKMGFKPLEMAKP